MHASATAIEAQRQQALVAALLGEPLAAEAAVHEQGERRRRGLSAYRANAEALAERALTAACPTVAALMGEENFAMLARALWREAPPRRGDLAQWGDDLPALIEAERDLDAWPYLADAARLDLALRECEAAADVDLDRPSLALLSEHEPTELQLSLKPSLRFVASTWPVASILAAHRREHGTDLDALRSALADPQPQNVIVSRARWRATTCAVDAPTFAWMVALQTGVSLSEALDAAGQAGAFDFNAWLIQALQQDWLTGAHVRRAIPTPEEYPR
jgi:hypothetical protein